MRNRDAVIVSRSLNRRHSSSQIFHVLTMLTLYYVDSSGGIYKSLCFIRSPVNLFDPSPSTDYK